jgi:hypothetical protein
MNLSLHCGAHLVTREDVNNSIAPAHTATHYPIDHQRLLHEVERALGYYDYVVANESHALYRGGERYFGLLELSSSSTDHTVVIGLRNCHDKSFRASLALGSGVFVCDNLCFTGQVIVGRRHTRHVVRDLPALVHRAVSRLADYRQSQEDQIVAFKSHQLTDDRAKSLLVNAMQRKILPCTQLPAITSEWESPRHDDFSAPTLWRLLNAVTEIGKSWTPENTLRRTQAFQSLLAVESTLTA